MEGVWTDGAFTATEVKVDADGDINSSRLACTVPDRSHAEFTPTGTWTSIEADVYSVNAADFSITVGEKTILIVRETFIKLNTAEAEQVICADAIPAGPGRVKVHFYEATDGTGNTVSVASKIRLGESSGSEWYDGSGGWSGYDGGSGFGGDDGQP